MRKHWLDLRWQFLILFVVLLGFVSAYTWAFNTGKIFEYNDKDGYGLVIGPGDYTELVRNHPTGRLFSMKETPNTYYLALEAMIRFLFPFIALLLGLGGLLSERSDGTTSFSFSFPVSRGWWLWSRAGMLLLLTFGMALMTCLVAFVLSFIIGVEPRVWWMLTTPLFAVVGAVPAIGLNLFAQSLFAGRFNNSDAEAVSAGIVAAFVLAVIAPFGPWLPFLSAKPVDWLLNGYIGATTTMPSERWIALTVAAIIGIGGFLLAKRRFERMDF